MTKLKVEVAQDHLERISQRSTLQALSELIWNALDGDASTIHVDLVENNLSGIEAVTVTDDGTGIPHSLALIAFRNLGDSWKKTRLASDGGRLLHGKAGEGRFAAFGLGSRVRWLTRWKDGKTLKQYNIVGNADSLREFDVSVPAASKERRSGTVVEVTGIHKDPKSLTTDDAPMRLAKEFATYLRQYPLVRLFFCGKLVDPGAVIDRYNEYDVTGCTRDDGSPIDAKLVVVEWKFTQERELCLCDAGGFTLATKSVGIQAKGYNFTAYLKSGILREYFDQSLLSLEELAPPVLLKLAERARKLLRDHFRRRAAEDAHDVVAQWKEDNVYPYQGKPRDMVEEVERQVFDVVALNINEYLPEFAGSDSKSKRLSLHILKTAIEESPSEVRRIVQEVLDLPKEKREELVELLDKTSLASIISAAKLVVDRLEFLAGLDAILFDAENREKLTERRQLHRILAENTWIFGEEFHLTVDDKGLTEVLRRHLALLGKDRTDLAPVLTADGTTGLVDLMLSRRIPQARAEELDHLVIELKRPTVKIDDEVVSQLKKYAYAVADDERFLHTSARWTFLAVSNELGKDVERSYFNQQDRPDGLVMNADRPPFIRMWVRSWGQILSGCRGRLEFIQTQLAYMADQDSGLEHLRRTYSKYLPSSLREGSGVEPFTRLSAGDVLPFKNSIPLYDLRIAAGQFVPDKLLAEVPTEGPFLVEDYVWVAPKKGTAPGKGLFVAQVVGDSMNRRVENGAWCVFRANPSGSLTGKPVIAVHRSISDSDFGGQYTFKVLEVETEITEDGVETVRRVVLKPDSLDSTYKPIVLEGPVEGELRIIAELVEVLIN